MDYRNNFNELCDALEGPGAFLTVMDKQGRVNIMTIGWAQAGVIWGLPVLTVLVRPSRHTHLFLSRASHFSVYVPAPGTRDKELAFCGSRSGRDYDKVRVCSFTLKEGVKKDIRYPEGPGLVYQCGLLGGIELSAGNLPAALRAKFYPDGDAHTMYFGKILKADKHQK